MLLGFFLEVFAWAQVAYVLYGSALRPFGRWARAMGTERFECGSRRTARGAKAISLCMIQPFIISVFQNLGSGCFFRSPAFFRNPAENFAGLRSGTFFRPKEDPGIIPWESGTILQMVFR